jgi:hypothetical protein
MTSPPYRERLTVSPAWWLLGLLFVVAVSWAFLVATPLVVAAIAAGITLVVVVWAMLHYGSLVISVDERGLMAGRATLPWSSIGPVEALDAAATRRVLGVDADARAFLVVRAYCSGSVRVVLRDDIDPTPYWLVSTRHPESLASRLGRSTMQD